MSLETIQQNYADATGYVIDRTVSPPKVLGLAFLVSRSRAVTCASVVFNYAEAPWALGVNFVHPDVVWGVKSLTLHNDFDKVAARKWYLAQTGIPGDFLSLPNDMASLVVDSQMAELQQDKVGELDRALALPFSNEGVEASGSIHGPEFLSVLTGILQSNREGLITLLDGRNLPIARIAVAPGKIQKVYFRGLLGELAFFELYHRKPAQGFSFQPEPKFNWGNVRDITAPAEALLQEAERRSNDLPSMLTYLGGAEARYQKRQETFAVQEASENIQWMVDRLWASIDGYLTLDKLSERVGADTYSVVQAIRELVNRAAVSLINRATPFHCNGQVGTPLISHTDFEINAWDPLQAFYLDPLSGCPTWLQGNFFGVANASQPKNMLHTVAFPINVPGALMLKDYKLIGVHSAPHVSKPGQPTPPVKLYQMMWMGALLDMSTKKVRASDDPAATGEMSLSGLRSKTDLEEEALAAQPEKLEKYVCPSCYTTNTKVGPCFNCGTVIEAPPPEPEPDKLSTAAAMQHVKKLQERFKLSNFQMVLIGSLVLGIPLCVLAAMVGSSSPPPPPEKTAETQSNDHTSSTKAMRIAVDMAGFKGTPIPGYWYEDTSELTKPTQSFGLSSELSNQRVVFLVFDDMSAVNNLISFVGLPPFTEFLKGDSLKDTRIDEGSQVLGEGNLKWFLGNYQRPSKDIPGKTISEHMLLGCYPSPVKGKSILMEGRVFKPDTNYDYKTTLWLCDQMAADLTAKGNFERGATPDKPLVAPGEAKSSAETGGEEALATDEDIAAYNKKIEESLQEKLKLPDDLKDLIDHHKGKKIKAGLKVGISEKGDVTKLEIMDGATAQSAIDALQKDVNSLAPFEDVPRTKDGTFTVLVKIQADKISVETP